MANTEFDDVNLAGGCFHNINMSGVRLTNINFTDASITGAGMGGAHFKHVGLPQDTDGEPQTLHFEECDLHGSTFSRCDLSRVDIKECNLVGMTINDIPVQDLVDVYHEKHGTSEPEPEPCCHEAETAQPETAGPENTEPDTA